MGRILIVDDEIKVCSILKEYFSGRGYTAYTAVNGEEAIEKVKEVKPHVVLLDIIMPGIGGIDVLKKIKRLEPSTGVIMITAIIDEELAREAIALGATDYITKPFDLTHVETVVMAKASDDVGIPAG